MANRLASATSPYLLQHAENPVDWREWGPEAFAEAKCRDTPILLSVGYSACHWCHVMAHESFEDAETAALMNDNYVCIKVDREERPDVDAVYMEATQAMTGSGGWPMTAFLTPAGAPFFCGTYFPPRPRPGIPSFRQLLAAVTDAWRQRRGELESVSADVIGKLNAADSLPRGGAVTAEPLAAGVEQLAASYDERNGGFGDAPKFPPSMVLEFLLRHVAGPAEPAQRMVEGTCSAMARGGIYDQLAGGFARYSVDGSWVVPHFEKMLYDNALLLRVYVHMWRRTGSELARRVAIETAGFLLTDLHTVEGGFAAALDADTGGVEGLTYVWSPAQLADVLGAEDGAWAAGLFGVTAEGTFDSGRSTLQLRSDPAGPSDTDRWRSVRQRLLAARRDRPQPARDDKVVTAWNGLAIAALAEAGALFEQQSYVDAAALAAGLILDRHLVDGRLRRTSRAGVVGHTAGVLEDYGNLAEGLLVLHEASGQGRWLAAAADLLEVALTRFSDGAGGFFDTADDAEQLVSRPRDPLDGATPAGASALAGALLRYSALTASTSHRGAAEQIAGRALPLVQRYPRAAGWAAAVAEAMLAGPQEIAVVGSPPDRVGLERVARRYAAAGSVVVAGLPDQPGVPLLAGRPLVDGGAAAFVCRNFVCAAPITDPEVLRLSLTRHGA